MIHCGEAEGQGIPSHSYIADPESPRIETTARSQRIWFTDGCAGNDITSLQKTKKLLQSSGIQPIICGVRKNLIEGETGNREEV